MERIKKQWENEELMMIGRREADGSLRCRFLRCFIAGRSDKSNDSGLDHHFTCGFDFGTLHKEERKNLC